LSLTLSPHHGRITNRKEEKWYVFDCAVLVQRNNPAIGW
jgi:hypothetical protein